MPQTTTRANRKVTERRSALRLGNEFIAVATAPNTRNRGCWSGPGPPHPLQNTLCALLADSLIFLPTDNGFWDRERLLEWDRKKALILRKSMIYLMLLKLRISLSPLYHMQK